MPMKFFNSISVLSTRKEPVSMEEAVKLAATQPKMRSLEEILASTKAIKTAATTATEKVVTAEVSKPNVQVKVAEMPEFIKKKIEEKKKEKGEGDKKDDAKDEDKKDKKDKKDEKSEEKDACTASVKLQMTKELDFRPFSAEKVVAAWKNAGGSIDTCVASVKGKTDDPKTYCGLLRAAAVTANKVIKFAADKKATKVATAATKSPAFKKLAKLTESERTELFSYWKQLYGEGYAKAMLEDY